MGSLYTRAGPQVLGFCTACTRENLPQTEPGLLGPLYTTPALLRSTERPEKK